MEQDLAKSGEDPVAGLQGDVGLEQRHAEVAQVLERAKNAAERRALADEFAADPWSIDGPGTDFAEVAELVREASRARNGWEVILRGCAPPRGRPVRQLVADQPS